MLEVCVAESKQKGCRICYIGLNPAGAKPEQAFTPKITAVCFLRIVDALLD